VDPLGRPVFQNQIYNPATTRLAPDGSTVRDPYVGNIVPLSAMDPVALKSPVHASAADQQQSDQ
jgi:hypothetical protein